MAEPPTVLVVDDGADVRLLCRVNLELEGYRVLEAGDGEQALARLAEEVPDVVLLDVLLPELDGWAVLERIKADPRTADVPVVMLTAGAQDHDQVRAWSAGAAGYLTEPFSPLSLSRAVQDAIDTDPEDEERSRRFPLDGLPLLGDHS